MDFRAILQVIERLYAAAASRDEWTPALDSLVSLFGAGHATLHVSGPDGVASSFAGLDAQNQALLGSPEAQRLFAPWAAASPINAAFANHHLWTDRDFERSAFYNEIIRPANGFYGACAIRLLPFGLLTVTVCRPRTAGGFDAAAIGTLQTLLPHLGTAVELHQRLRVATDGYENLTRIIDRLDCGVILTDAACTPVFVNAQALRIAAEADGLSLNGALTGASAEFTRRLRDAVAQTAMDVAIEPINLALERPSRRPPLKLTLLPIWRLGAVVSGVRAPKVAIFVTTPDARGPINREAVADALRLTRRESEVAVLLAEGSNLASIAGALGIRVGAVRQYLKRAFDKTGVRNQAALAALIRGFADPCS